MDSRINLDSYEALKYFWNGWKVGGIIPFTQNKHVFVLYSVLFNTAFAIIFPATLFIRFIVDENMEQKLFAVSFAADIVSCILKQSAIFLSRHYLYSIKDILKELDKNVASEDEKICLRNAIKMCRVIFVGFNCLCFMTVLMFALFSLCLKHGLPFPAWYPFNITVEKYFWIAFSHQIISLLLIGVQNITLDMYPVGYSYVLIAHIEILMLKIGRVGIGNQTSVKDNYKELIRSINIHKNILRLFDEISILISRTVSFQFLVTAFVLCIAAVYLIFFSTGLVEIIAIVMYLTAAVVEVLPSCYYASRLMDYNERLTGAIFSCNWMDQDRKFKKTIIIFMQRTQKSFIILAWNMVPISLPTFLGVRLNSYTYL